MSAVGTTLFIAQGVMRAKPDMKSWVRTDKTSQSSTGAALTASVWFVSLRFVALHSLGKYRSYGAQKMCETD